MMFNQKYGLAGLKSSKMMKLSCLFLIIIATLISFADSKKAPECSTCKEIVDNFHKGLLATEKSNFGGGNSNWEENSLGPYAFSEVRLVEIMDQLCGSKSTECHSLLEEHEDLVENFWFKQFAMKSNKDFLTFFCIENVKACCPNNTYGKDCEPCPGGVDKPCQGNGKCDGEGTRKGSGKCKCSTGYKGEICSECKEGYYMDQKSDNPTQGECKMCHISCKGGCDGHGRMACHDCKDGWEKIQHEEHEECKDINECQEEPCSDNQYCTNTQGSYTCFTCDSACVSCKSSGPHNCNECREGYARLEDGKCEDTDECKLDASLCSKENEECVNTPGAYECICSTGYEYKDGECVKSPKEDDEEEDTADEEDEKTEEKSPKIEL